ncbi:MAG: hypothetical protein ACLUG9_16390 [Paraclostridium sordellii]
MKLSEFVNQNENLENLRKENIELYKLLLETGSKINALAVRTWNEERFRCEESVKNLFEEEGFSVNREKDKYIFVKGDISIEFYYDGVDEMIIFQMKFMPSNKYFAVQIRPNTNGERMLCWKNILQVDGKHLFKENYTEIINQCTTPKELEKLKKQLKENIEHYEDTLKSYDSIKYIYSLYKEYMECDTFKELLEEHILPQV